jgi:hypothetical protein
LLHNDVELNRPVEGTVGIASIELAHVGRAKCIITKQGFSTYRRKLEEVAKEDDI